MSELRTIFNKVYGTYPDFYGHSPTKEEHDQTEQAILALVPEKKDLHPREDWLKINYRTYPEDVGYNEAIDEMHRRMEERNELN